MAIIPTTLGNPQGTDIALETALPFIGNASRQDLQSTLGQVDPEISKLFEDRNLILTQGGLITFTGTQLQTTEDLNLEVNSQVAGGTPTIIDLGPGPFSLSASGTMVYAVVNRTLGTATVTDNATTLPAVVYANQEVFLIAKRVDAPSPDNTMRCYLRDGTVINAGDTTRLGGSAGATYTSSDELDNLGIASSVISSSSPIAENSAENTTVGTTAPADWWGQGVTTTAGGAVSGVQLTLSWSGGTQPSGPFNVGIYTTVGGTLLGTSNAIDASTFTNTPTVYNFTFTSGPTLSTSTFYFLTLQPGGSNLYNGSTINIGDDNTGSYAGGHAYFTSSGNSSGPWTNETPNALTFSVNTTSSTGLQVNLKQFDGATDPNSGEVVVIGFRDATVTSGGYTLVNVSAPLDIVAPTGATFGLNSGQDQSIYVYACNNAGTVALALAGSDNFDEGTPQDTSQIASTVFASYTTTPNADESFSANNEYSGQPFQPSSTGSLGSATWYLYTNGVASSGNIVCEIHSDSGGLPGTLLETSSPISAVTLTSSGTGYTFTFSGSTTLIASTTYHIVLNFSGVTYGGGALINIGSVTPLAYTYAVEVSTNSGSTWASLATSAYYFSVNSSAATSHDMLYSTSALSGVPVRLIGRITVDEVVAGTYATAPVQLSVNPMIYTPSAPTMTTLTSGSGTYTTPAGVAYLRVRIVGAGGGGGNGGSSGPFAGNAGLSTTFGSMTANGGGGGGGAAGGSVGGGGSGGSASVTGIGFALTGGSGTGAADVSGALVNGGAGGNSVFGGGGGGAGGTGGGFKPVGPNTGSGGGGGAGTTYGGSGGGAGGYAEAIVYNPLSSYSYSVGSGGTPAGGGGSGADGIIIVEEWYP